MPYADPDRQREVQREATRRRRQAKRDAAPPPAPASPPVVPVVTIDDLYMAGRILGRAKGHRESPDEYRAVLVAEWARLLRVVEPPRAMRG